MEFAVTFFKGHDLSSLAILEKGGFTFKDPTRGNATRAADDMLGEGGMNTVRLRCAHDNRHLVRLFTIHRTL